jgi:5-methylcytosine-specific restriction endonuclease McrA
MDTMTRGLHFLTDRPGCHFPTFEIMPRYWRPARRKLERRPQPSSRRSTSDKTGEATRRRIREALLRRYGPLCHLCLAGGVTDSRAVIDLDLKWPHPQCFTRDHIKPRSLRGTNSIRNQRPAHKICNERRGNRPLTREATP